MNIETVKIVIEITQAEMKALEYVAVDPVEWITNLTRNRAAAAMQEIYEVEMDRLMADPEVKTIPASKALVVAQADLPSAAERHAAFLANPPIPPEPIPEPRDGV